MWILELINCKYNLGKQYANRLIFYFAAENKDDLPKHKIKYTPEDAYDDYDNSGTTILDNNGKVKLVIENPISYYVEEDNMSYPPHVHFFVSNKKNTQWLKKIL